MYLLFLHELTGQKNHRGDTLQPHCHRPVARKRHCVLSSHLCCSPIRVQALWDLIKATCSSILLLEMVSSEQYPQTVSVVIKTGCSYSPHPAPSFGTFTETHTRTCGTSTFTSFKQSRKFNQIQSFKTEMCNFPSKFT